MEKKLALFCIAAERYSGLEVLFPIINELKKNKLVSNASLFFNKKSSVIVSYNRDSIIKRISSSLFSKIIVSKNYMLPIYFFIFFLKNFLKCNVLIMGPNKMDDSIINKIKFFNFVKFIGYPNVTSFYNDENVLYRKNIINLNFNCIGYPKFYSSWFTIINKFISNKDKTKKIIIFLPSIVEPVFSTNDFKEWFISVSNVIKEKKFKEQIVIKPHPMLKQNIIKFVKQNSQDIDNYIIENSNSLSLLQNVSFVITADSSIIMDCIYLEIKTLFYQKFTPNWLKRHPYRSKFLNLGAIYSDNLEDFKKNVDKIFEFQMPPKEIFLSKIEHKNNLLSFMSEHKIIP